MIRLLEMKEKRIALVTGGNRGLGLETCRQLGEKGLIVLLASRSRAAGEKAAVLLRSEGLDVRAVQLDVTESSEIRKAFRLIKKEYGRLDVLVNNAGAFLDVQGSAVTAKKSTIQKSMEVNAFSAFEMCQMFFPLMVSAGYGRIVNVSSRMGQLTYMNGTRPGYRISKAALNAVTRIFSDEAKGSGVLVNSVCPGWVRTRMGGKNGELTPAEGAETIVWLVTLPKSGPTGGFFAEKKKISW